VGDYEPPSNVKVLSLGKERTPVSRNFFSFLRPAPFKKIKYLLLKLIDFNILIILFFACFA